MAREVTAEERARLREWHIRFPRLSNKCRCEEWLPCPTIRLLDALEAAEALAELRGKALEAVEWVADEFHGEGFCPWCDARDEDEGGHKPGCLRQRALGLEVKHE